GSPAVGGGDGMGVDGQGRRGVGVAETFADRPDGDAAVEEPRRDVVAEVVQADGLEPDLLPELGEAAGGAGVGPPRKPARDIAGEDMGIAGELRLADFGPILGPLTVLLQRRNGPGVEGDAPA